MTAPTFIIQATDQESLEQMPNLYIKTLEEAIRANSDRPRVIEHIRVRLINLRAEVDNIQDRLWANENSVDITPKENFNDENLRVY